MTIQEILTNPNCWQNSEVSVLFAGRFVYDKYILCSDENGFFLRSESGVEIRDIEELGDNVDKLQISIVY